MDLSGKRGRTDNGLQGPDEQALLGHEADPDSVRVPLHQGRSDVPRAPQPRHSGKTEKQGRSDFDHQSLHKVFVIPASLIKMNVYLAFFSFNPRKNQ